jgi:hypothetical protein
VSAVIWLIAEMSSGFGVRSCAGVWQPRDYPVMLQGHSEWVISMATVTIAEMMNSVPTAAMTAATAWMNSSLRLERGQQCGRT